MADDTRCTPGEFEEMTRRGDEICLLDVRTEQELGIVCIEGCTHIPLDQLPWRIGELESWRNGLIVVMCHHGTRSEMAQGFLRANGFSRVLNLTGGIDAYATEVDPSLVRY